LLKKSQAQIVEASRLRNSSQEWDSLVQELELLAVLARELGLWVVVGSSHRLTPPHRPHNRLYVISAKWELVTTYDKQYCFRTEITNWYTPGRGCCVFEVAGWRFGCALCIEIHFPELFLRYAELGVDCILFSSYSDEAMFGIQVQGCAARRRFSVVMSPASMADTASRNREPRVSGWSRTCTPSRRASNFHERPIGSRLQTLFVAG
jgi:predicted amidohydrolase